MNKLGLKGKQRKNNKYHSYKGEEGKIAYNILKLEFTTEKLFENLTTDITKFRYVMKICLSPASWIYATGKYILFDLIKHKSIAG